MSSTYRFDTQLLPLLPPWYREIQDYQQICGTEQTELELVTQWAQKVGDNFAFQSMDSAALSEWEAVFGLVADPQKESLAFRRTRLINRISSTPPFTLEFLRGKLDELIGPGAWTVRVDYPNYTLYVESSAQNQSYAVEVAYTVGRIKPAHMVFINTPYLREPVLLSERIFSAYREYNYRLGAWGLGMGPFAAETEKGVIKLPTAKSVQPTLLAATAGFLAGNVATARLNGAVVIPAGSLTKTVEGETLTVTYPVSAQEVTEITQLELLDADGAVLTSAAAYVPVEAGTVIKHVLPVTEGVNTDGR